MGIMGTLKLQSDGQLYYEVGTLAVDGWAVTSGTARRDLGGLRPRPGPSSLYYISAQITAHPSTASIPTSYYSIRGTIIAFAL